MLYGPPLAIQPKLITDKRAEQVQQRIASRPHVHSLITPQALEQQVLLLADRHTSRCRIPLPWKLEAVVIADSSARHAVEVDGIGTVGDGGGCCSPVGESAKGEVGGCGMEGRLRGGSGGAAGADVGGLLGVGVGGRQLSGVADDGGLRDVPRRELRRCGRTLAGLSSPRRVDGALVGEDGGGAMCL